MLIVFRPQQNIWLGYYNNPNRDKCLLVGTHVSYYIYCKFFFGLESTKVYIYKYVQSSNGCGRTLHSDSDSMQHNIACAADTPESW